MTDIWKMPDPNDFFITIVDWNEPKRFDVSAYLNARDAWLDRFRGKYLNLTDYERWWMELRDLLREYLVDCNDADIIIGELKDWKEKAEKLEAINTAMKKAKDKDPSDRNMGRDFMYDVEEILEGEG